MKLSAMDKLSCFLAELIGTGLLVFLGCMGCVDGIGQNSHLQKIINFGLTIMLIIQIFGCVSGSHLNPAVTAAAYIYKLVSLPMAGVYFVGQMIGGFIGYGMLFVVTPAKYMQMTITQNGTILALTREEHDKLKLDENISYATGLCVTKTHPEVTFWQGLIVEFIITMCLILVCCGVWDPRNAKHHDSVPIKFGLTVSALACAAGPWTGGSMNPARSFAPALWHFDFEDHYIYWVSPMLAGFVTALAYKAVFWREAPPENEKSRLAEEFPLSRNNV